MAHKCVVRNGHGLGYSFDREVVTVMMICVSCETAQSVWNFKFIDYYCNFPLCSRARSLVRMSLTADTANVSIVPAVLFDGALFLALILLYACYWYLTKSKYNFAFIGRCVCVCSFFDLVFPFLLFSLFFPSLHCVHNAGKIMWTRWFVRSQRIFPHVNFPWTAL